MARTRIVVGLAAALAALSIFTPAFAKKTAKPGKPNATVQVVPPGAQVEGKDYAEWSAA